MDVYTQLVTEYLEVLSPGGAALPSLVLEQHMLAPSLPIRQQKNKKNKALLWEISIQVNAAWCATSEHEW